MLWLCNLGKDGYYRSSSSIFMTSERCMGSRGLEKGTAKCHHNVTMSYATLYTSGLPSLSGEHDQQRGDQ